MEFISGKDRRQTVYTILKILKQNIFLHKDAKRQCIA
jgi:2-C-methyl-D-erythritol 4-phosphate cytidylyltransferase